MWVQAHQDIRGVQHHLGAENSTRGQAPPCPPRPEVLSTTLAVGIAPGASTSPAPGLKQGQETGTFAIFRQLYQFLLAQNWRIFSYLTLGLLQAQLRVWLSSLHPKINIIFWESFLKILNFAFYFEKTVSIRRFVDSLEARQTSGAEVPGSNPASPTMIMIHAAG